jgi:PAS domain S-box-containing protein
MRTFLGVPIRYGDESLGNLYLTEKEDGQEFTEEDRNLLTMFAAQGAMAINNAHRFQAEQEARAEAEGARQALSESEQLNRSILDSTMAVIYVKDARGRYITVNRRFEDLFHVRKEEIKGKTDYDVLSQEMADVFTANDRKVLDSHKALEVEEIAVHDDGAHTYMSSKVPIFDSTGVPYAVCSISTDITARQEIEQLKADFLSMVTHDLRGPISAIKGLSGTLLIEQDAWDKTTILEDINTIDEEADRMAELVGNLLDMSRIEANSMPQDPETCHLADITSECIRQIEKSRIGGQHGIHAEVPLELPELYADYNQISRVIFNLLSNAIKYSPQGSEVHLRCYVDPEDRGMIVTEVEDHGVGIPTSDVRKIFDKFFRVTSQRGRGRPGAGLGLAICKSIVEAHDGKIWVDSEPGKGSTFFFSLPSAVVSVGI